MTHEKIAAVETNANHGQILDAVEIKRKELDVAIENGDSSLETLVSYSLVVEDFVQAHAGTYDSHTFEEKYLLSRENNNQNS